MHTPLRALAEEIGISKSAVDQFYKQSSYPGKVWPRLREWYMNDRASRRELPRDTPDELISLMPLFDGIPLEELPDAMRKTAAVLRSVHEGRDRPPPQWISSIYGWADYYEEQSRAEQN